ncbi:Protein STU1 [Vanrija pseudolonga]|uniref:Protein STU1 n=1 Tax=Vanrija pseudolonga TaxID=143232 RepID=A0AAF0YFC1_9TREE|nr:Protein STU1 [Vanrija pseudolonga]
MVNTMVSEEEVEAFLVALRAGDVDKKINLVQLWAIKLDPISELPDKTVDAITLLVAPFLRSPSHLLVTSALSAFLPAYIPLIPSAAPHVHHLQLALVQLVPGLIERLNDPKDKVHEPASQCLALLGNKAYEAESPAPSQKGKAKDGMASIWEKAVKDTLAGKNSRAKIVLLKLLLAMRSDKSSKLPLKPWLPGLVNLLEDGDGSVRDQARETVVALLSPPTVPAAARSELKKLMLARNVRKSIADVVIARVLGGDSGPAPAQTETETAVPAESAAKPSQLNGNEEVEVVLVASAADLQSEFKAMVPHFQGKETEHNWGPRERSLVRMRGMLRGGASSKYSDAFLASLKGDVIDGIAKTLLSLRTTVAQQACALVQELAESLGTSFDACLEPLLPVLGKMAGFTKKIIADKSQRAVTAIIIHSTLHPRPIISHIAAGINDKSIASRQFGAAHLKTFLENQARPHLSAIEAHAGTVSEIEQLLRRCLADTSTGVREQARGAFWAFDKVWPRQAASILDSLDSTAKKQLEKANPKGTLSAGGSARTTPNRPRQSSAMAAMIAARRAKAAADKASSTNGSSRAASPNASPSAVSRTAGNEAGVPDNTVSARQAKATSPPPAGEEGSPQPPMETASPSPSSPPDVDALALGVGALGLHQNNGHAAASASSSPPKAPEAASSPISSTLFKASTDPRPTPGDSRLTTDSRRGVEQRNQPLGVENLDNAHASQTRRRVSAQSEKRLSTHSVKSDKSRSSAQLGHPPRVGQRATVIPTPVLKTNAASSQASSRSRSSSLARTLSHSPPSLLDSMPRSLRHSDMRDAASSDTSAGGSHLRTPTLPRFHLPRSHPEPVHYQAESSLPPHRGVASRNVSDSVNTTPFARRRSFVPDGPVDPADDARRAQVAQGLSAAQQLLDFDDDQMDLATAPITPARPGSSSVSIAQPFRTPVSRQRQIWEDSPRAMTPRLLHDLKSRAHERSWWKERQKLLDQATSLNADRELTKETIEEDVGALTSGSPTLGNLQRLVLFSQAHDIALENSLDDEVDREDIAEQKLVWEEQRLFDRVFDGLMAFLDPKRATNILEQGLVLLWELVQNQWVLCESREDDLLDSLFVLRSSTNPVILESTNSLVSLLTEVCNPPFLLLLLHSALDRYIAARSTESSQSNLAALQHESAHLRGDRARVSGYNFGLNAMGMCILHLPKEAVETEARRLERQVMAALSLTTAEGVLARQAAHRVILAVQCMLGDDVRTLALFPDLDAGQRSFATYLMQQNGVMNRASFDGAEDAARRQAVLEELLDGLTKGARLR